MPIGRRLGPYEVLTPLGRGGMGEVYRAHDTTLNRDVALKVLPEAFAADPDRVARFRREAQVLAALNHPNIAAIYGFEESGGVHALVLELVEGPTLADRIAEGPIPPDEALAIARTIAEALEAAHEHGIVHRDLKPSNVKVRPDGTVKVLDFGLAKALEPLPGATTDRAETPTITSPAMTQVGVILGTAAYMSPEQAKGRAADKRCDVWAFGCVLYEMLSGRRAFPGDDVTDTLASVLRGEPDWQALPEGLPAAIRVLIERCLRKEPRTRISDLSAARLMIEEAATLSAVDARGHGLPQPQPRRWMAWTAAGIAIAALLVAAFVFARNGSRTQAPPVVRFEIQPPSGTAFASGTRGARMAVSPDGTMVAFSAFAKGKPNQIWVRRLDAVTATALAGTDGADTVFWSPDNRFIGFFAGDKLKKVDVAGGPPQTLCDVTLTTSSGTWSRDGVIVFSSGAPSGLRRVSAEGGEPTVITTGTHLWPRFLPDGRHFLFFDVNADPAGVFLGSLDSMDLTRVVTSQTLAEFVEPGYLLFVRDEALFVQPFDRDRLELHGEAIRITQNVSFDPNNGRAGFSVAGAGVLVYAVTSAPAGTDLELTVFDRAGAVLSRTGGAWPYRSLDLSPDGKRIASHRHDDQGGDIWITDLTTGDSSRLTFDHSQHNHAPVWSPDGARVAFSSFRNGSWGVYEKASNGVGAERLLYESTLLVTPMDWSRDGMLVICITDPVTEGDLWLLPATGDKKPTPYVQGPGHQTRGQVSADGRWVVYDSTESGQANVYVQSFPSPSTKYQVSTRGGSTAHWSPDDREILFSPGNREGIASVRVERVREGLKFASPVPLFNSGFVAYRHRNGSPDYFEFATDGTRFVTPIPRDVLSDTPTPLTVALNWAPLGRP